MQRFCLLRPLVAGLVSSAPASAQPIPTATATLGHSLAPLNGPWKFHIGDNPQWANPNFDHSGSETVNLTPKAAAKPVSPAEIAAARKFGQNDDISILSITRTAVLEEALA